MERSRKISVVYFNSQPHKEADLKIFWFYTISIYFNSQPHKEADKLTELQNNVLTISTHSLTRRLTKDIGRYHNGECISTHSLTRRLTSHTWKPCLRQENFNSQPHKEADRYAIY